MLKREAREILGLEDDADLRVVSDRVYDICEYLAMLLERGELRTDFGPLPMTVTYHAPCQQQGHGIGKPALDLMALVPELRVIENDATCCGVAGTYGLEDARSTRSRWTSAPGCSGRSTDARPELAVCDSETCRWHIEKATGVRTVHPVEILHRAAGLVSVVGLVIVSHSATLAAGVVELARQMGGDEVAIEPAGGMADPPGEIGTDMELVLEAIERAAAPDGVLVLMDLGSAVMSAEMAAEMVDDVRVLLCEAPIVEGAVAAAARARTGASLEEVAAEARAALGMKAAQLGVEEAAPRPRGAPDGRRAAHELRLEVPNRSASTPGRRPASSRPRARFDAAITRRRRDHRPRPGRRPQPQRA